MAKYFLFIFLDLSCAGAREWALRDLSDLVHSGIYDLEEGNKSVRFDVGRETGNP